MTQEQYDKLGVGDIIRRKGIGNSKSIMVSSVIPGSKIGVSVHHISNADDWELVCISMYEEPHVRTRKPQLKVR